MRRRYLYAALSLTTAAYAWLLERHKKQLEPNWTWAEVVVGTMIVLAFAHLQRRATRILEADEFERVVWLSFGAGGIPIIIWQFWQRVSDLQGALAEATAN